MSYTPISPGSITDIIIPFSFNQATGSLDEQTYGRIYQGDPPPLDQTVEWQGYQEGVQNGWDFSLIGVAFQDYVSCIMTCSPTAAVGDYFIFAQSSIGHTMGYDGYIYPFTVVVPPTNLLPGHPSPITYPNPIPPSPGPPTVGSIGVYPVGGDPSVWPPVTGTPGTTINFPGGGISSGGNITYKPVPGGPSQIIVINNPSGGGGGSQTFNVPVYFFISNVRHNRLRR